MCNMQEHSQTLKLNRNKRTPVNTDDVSIWGVAMVTTRVAVVTTRVAVVTTCVAMVTNS